MGNTPSVLKIAAKSTQKGLEIPRQSRYTLKKERVPPKGALTERKGIPLKLSYKKKQKLMRVAFSAIALVLVVMLVLPMVL